MRKGLLLLPLLFLASCGTVDSSSSFSSPSSESSTSSPTSPSSTIGTSSSSSSSALSGSVSDALNYAKERALTLEGDCTLLVNDSETPYAHYVLGFDEQAISVREDLVSIDGTMVEGTETIYFAKENGKTYSRQINLDNEVEDVPLLSGGESVAFAENFPNPFSVLKFSDILSYENTYLLKPNAISTFSLYALHQSVSPTKIELSMEEGRFTHIRIETSTYGGLGGVGLSYRYDLAIRYDTPISAPELTPYPTEEEHATLEAALARLDEKVAGHNYTIEMKLDAGSGAVPFAYYVTEEGHLDTSIDSSGAIQGLIRQHDGYHYFTYASGTATIDDSEAYDLDEIELDFLSFAPELFVSQGKSFHSRSGYAASLSTMVAPMLYRDYLASCATDVEIAVEGEDVRSLEIFFVDLNNMISGSLSMSFTDFQKTTWPIEI